MKRLIVLVLLCLSRFVDGQVLQRAEYFFDTDPGFNNGTPLNITIGDSFIYSGNIPTAGLSEGLHQLCVRAVNSSGIWSLTQKHTFYITRLLIPSTSLVKAEYFVDDDPGPGSGSPISTGIPTGSISISFSVPTIGLSSGFHLIGVRTLDQDGIWSLSGTKIFYIKPNDPNTPAITAAEYFIDTDPGQGNGNAIAVPTNDTVSNGITINSAGLDKGFHFLYFRVRDLNGVWSISRAHSFFIDKQLLPAAPLDQAEYFFNYDPGAGNGISLPITAGDSIVYIGNIPPVDTLLGSDTLYMRVRDTSGVWSSYARTPYTICTERGPISNFSYVNNGTSVFFVNHSQYDANTLWIFGDGNTSTLRNPMHVYTPGIYNACLISSNVCGIDTLCTTLTVKGITTINTNHGGNAGAVSVTVSGAGFLPGMQLWLGKTGQANINGDTIVVLNDFILETSFDLTGQLAGEWNVVAVFPTGDTAVLVNGFTIEQGGADDLWVNITGDPVLRIGFNQIYSITYGNKGNLDAVFVPLMVGGLPLGTEIELLNTVLNYDTVSGLDTLGNYNASDGYTLHDSVLNISYRGIYIGKIPAGFTGTLSFIFHVPPGTLLHSTPLIEIGIGAPFYNSTDGLIKSAANIGTCTASLMKNVLETIAPSPGVQAINCVNSSSGLFKSIYDTYKYYTTKPRGYNAVAHSLLNFHNLAYKFTKVVTSCANLAGQIPLTKGTQIGVKLTWNALMNYEYTAGCADLYARKAYASFRSIIGNATDPNNKYGPGGASESHYLTDDIPMPFMINFENDSNSNALVQHVEVIDTLNATDFNRSTFKFTGVTIGDQSFTLPYPSDFFLHDFSFRQQFGIDARAVGTYNEVEGIVNMNIYTIDTTTGQITTNALAGFLPPDTLSPYGQGSFSFIVDPTDGITSGDTTANTAYIYFDANPPIQTPSWTNIFDLDPPVSNVTSLLQVQQDSVFDVFWTGADIGSGIAGYNIYYSINGGNAIGWLANTSDTTAVFTGSPDSSYCFYSVAYDSAGNYEEIPVVFDACTYVAVGIQSEQGNTMHFNAQPNPSSGNFNVTFIDSENEIVELVVTDLCGKIVSSALYTAHAGNNSCTISLQQLNSGMYLLRLKRKHDEGVLRIIKN